MVTRGNIVKTETCRCEGRHAEEFVARIRVAKMATEAHRPKHSTKVQQSPSAVRVRSVTDERREKHPYAWMDTNPTLSVPAQERVVLQNERATRM
jgi:hypothetical protein